MKAKLYALIHIVLGGLDHLEIASFEDIIKGHRRGLTADYGDPSCFLRFIFVFNQFGHSVNARAEIVFQNNAAVGRFHGFIHTGSLNAEGDAVHLAVLRGLDDFGRAIRNLNVKIAFYGVAD